eukprot:CAMPEP_0204263358 /NCGR_PEP_ID=MMETSP0468-20130131/8304_1 /ASSEMBLY_ACC=CAM_ASM_000383 /TAXON_ID=2969 /ORGANISM="Oxyrrhis marina" /LENGTH=40 /DNA_ID= /DNA_START= /DNA_END= /DNA_ORIENTATION=
MNKGGARATAEPACVARWQMPLQLVLPHQKPHLDEWGRES